VAELAAQRAGGQGATGLRPLLERASACLAQEPADWRAFLEVDVALHIAVAELSGNPMFVAVLQVVHERILAGSDRFATRERPRLQAMFDDLSAMVGAIEAGRAGEARERAVAHVREYGRQFGRPGLSPGRLSGNTE
jgi:DNA-binding FadR family transcriptional regulator